MEKNWLKNRLTAAKADSPLWAAFADALQTIWGEVIEGTLTRISDRKSFFTMDPEDMETRISEYGRFFTITEKSPTRRPILLMQRLDEVHFKGTEQPLEQTFWREFGEMPVSWEPLYAPIDQESFPYGSIFVTKADISFSEPLYGDFFLTSRGMILINLNELATRYGRMGKDEAVERLLKDFDKIVAPLLPLHIVFDGVTLRLVVEFKPDYVEALLLNHIEAIDTQGKIFTSASDNLTQRVETETSIKINDIKQGRKPYQIHWDTMPVDAWLIDHKILNQVNEFPEPEVTEFMLLPGEEKQVIVTMTPGISDDVSFSAYSTADEVCSVTFDEKSIVVCGRSYGIASIKLVSNTGNVSEVVVKVVSGAKFNFLYDSTTVPVFYAKDISEMLVDWGDGILTDNYNESTPGTNGILPPDGVLTLGSIYTVSVYSVDDIAFGKMLTKRNANYLLSVDNFSSQRSNLEYAFYNQAKLVDVLNLDLPNFEEANSFMENCSLVERLPDGFLAGHTKITSLYKSFADSGLKVIPEGFISNALHLQNIYGTFKSCPLEDVPDGLLYACSESLINCSLAFNGCKHLKTDINEIFTADDYPLVTNSSYLFSGDSNVQGEGNRLIAKLSAVSLYSSTFTNCTNLIDYKDLPNGWK